MTPSDEELVAEARAMVRGLLTLFQGKTMSSSDPQTADIISRLADRLSALSRPGLDRGVVARIIDNEAFEKSDYDHINRQSIAVHKAKRIIALTTGGERTSGGEMSSSQDSSPAVGVALEEWPPTDWFCPVCRCRTFAYIKHYKDISGLCQIRCVECKRVWDNFPLSSAKPADRERSRDDIETSGRHEQPAASSGLSNYSREGRARAEEVAPTDSWAREQIKRFTILERDDKYEAFIRREAVRIWA